MNISFQPLTATDIPIFFSEDTLHVVDFRATAETLQYKIDSMWRYENWLSSIFPRSPYLVNEDASSLHTSQIVVRKGEASDESIASRFLKMNNLSNFKRIFAHVAHPDIDACGSKYNVPVSYSYPDFLKFNNKLTQKTLFGDLTPSWKEVESGEVWDPAYRVIKRADSSGGWGVFIDGVQTIDSLRRAYAEFKESRWYKESFCSGVPMSVQVYKSGSEIVVFGFGVQIIENSRNFIGAELKNVLDTLEQYPWIENNITDAILKLNTLIQQYEGFLGFDFLLDVESKSISILEANVRMTSLSVPMLIANQKQRSGGLYEGYKGAVTENDIVLATDVHESDVVRFA